MAAPDCGRPPRPRALKLTRGPENGPANWLHLGVGWLPGNAEAEPTPGVRGPEPPGPGTAAALGQRRGLHSNAGSSVPREQEGTGFACSQRAEPCEAAPACSLSGLPALHVLSSEGCPALCRGPREVRTAGLRTEFCTVPYKTSHFIFTSALSE